MKDILKIAWRSLWRNSRRTMITVASIFFGIFFSVFMTSLQQGSFENMVDNMVRFYSGYIQVQEKDFRDLHSVNNSFLPSDEISRRIENNPLITQSTKRIESVALAGSEKKSYPAMVFGIQPEKEEAISGLSKWISEGDFIPSGSKDILVGKILADNMELHVGDSLVMIGQGYHGVSAAGLYRVAGLLDFPLPDLSKQIIYMDLGNMQEFLSMPELITSYVLMVNNPDDVKPAILTTGNELPQHLSVYAWDELQPALQSLIEGKTASGKLIKTFLFMVIGFGIWATIIMLMHERIRELGVMIAIGFQKTRIMVMILIESFFIGLLGILAGIIISLPLVVYLYHNPIHVTGEMAETYRSMGFEPVLKFGLDYTIEIYFVVKLNPVAALRA
ncbi:MAG: ABC transporter permease [bacterium]